MREHLLWTTNPDMSASKASLGRKSTRSTDDRVLSRSSLSGSMRIFSCPRELEPINSQCPDHGIGSGRGGRRRPHPSPCKAASPSGPPSSGDRGRPGYRGPRPRSGQPKGGSLRSPAEDGAWIPSNDYSCPGCSACTAPVAVFGKRPIRKFLAFQLVKKSGIAAAG